MKRELLYLIILFFSLVSVNAQTAFLGEDFSIIILLPLVLIVIVAIAFGVMFIVDTKNYYVSKKVVNVPELGKAKVIEVIKEEVKKDGEKEEKIQKVWINYLDVIDTFAKRLDERETKEAFNILVRMIREFFKDRFNLDYEFTYDELLKEFDNKKLHNKELISSLRELTYKDQKIDKKIVYNLSTKFREIIRIIDKEKLDELEGINIDKNLNSNKMRKMIYDIRKKENKIDEALNSFIGEEKRKIFNLNLKRKPKTEVRKDFDTFDKDKLEQVNLLIKNGKETLKSNNLIKLKEIYGDICYLFPFLSDKSKKIAYLEILEFYEDINMKLFPKLYKEMKK